MLHHRLNCSHIYYVYVYKSLRRPHIPEACKESGGRESDRKLGETMQQRLGTGVKMCDERSGGGHVVNRESPGSFIPATRC